MKEFSYVINDPLGIHARPAGLLVKKASTFNSDITIVKGEKTADSKKIFGIMGLGIKQGDEITIKITGEDEEEASAAIEEFVKENL
ncbi:HPr family phosphocarrier protein [Lachnoclostridium phytofermentans]|uniref:Phosphotransferase system, phosphocarrier protein HPr n=1 Tax=Lachnoclostridium phytofermentans (strain ATCC 700394 / DSM 18823 / ISDg) TaxID=357809 RepID=A9KSA9_LACP7|nr:HPr family phosphocarrier protein [Lachnoclostridium phytofermentans]ABX42141.1 Phosphotransferase system, phosphocarrier protein HPr [Lachnoclostridium phytofermentans ISDg]